MSFETLVLSADPRYGASVAGSLGGTSQVVTRWEDARRLIGGETAPVIVFDADQPIAEAQLVLDTSAQAKRPVIVIAKWIDSSRWVHYFRAGAFDVLRAPAGPGQLRHAVKEARRAFGLALAPPDRWSRLRALLFG